MKFQNFAVFSFQRKTSNTSVKTYGLRYSRNTFYFYFFKVCILAPYALKFNYGQF